MKLFGWVRDKDRQREIEEAAIKRVEGILMCTMRVYEQGISLSQLEAYADARNRGIAQDRALYSARITEDPNDGFVYPILSKDEKK